MKPFKRLYYTSMFFVGGFWTQPCKTYIWILFTNKNLACVQAPPLLKKGGGSVCCTQAIKKSHSFIHSQFVRKKSR